MVKFPSKSIFGALLASSIFMTSTGNVLAEPSVNDLEEVVISLHTDPTRDPEPACVALQIGINLLRDTVPDENNTPVTVTPADAVTLFLTTGGVELVNPDNNIYKRAKPKAVCDTPGEQTATLQQLLQGFIMEGGVIVLCPLCADARGITAPTFDATKANGVQIHDLFLYADKVINF